jgi:hypothetical protein
MSMGLCCSSTVSADPDGLSGCDNDDRSCLKKENAMGELVHTSRIKIVREKGPTRRAVIEGFDEPIYYGVHGGIKSFYKVEPEKEHAATLDHIVAATAG